MYSHCSVPAYECYSSAPDSAVYALRYCPLAQHSHTSITVFFFAYLSPYTYRTVFTLFSWLHDRFKALEFPKSGNKFHVCYSVLIGIFFLFFLFYVLLCVLCVRFHNIYFIYLYIYFNDVNNKHSATNKLWKETRISAIEKTRDIPYY